MKHLSMYKRHPRFLELRIILIFTCLERDYGYARAIEILEYLCMITQTNFRNILTIINNEYPIRKLSKTNKERWYQELVLLGALYGERKSYISAHFLQRHKTFLYNMKHVDLDVESFATEEWLKGLDESVVICAIPQQKLEAQRFIDGLYHFLEVIVDVPVSKV